MEISSSPSRARAGRIGRALCFTGLFLVVALTAACSDGGGGVVAPTITAQPANVTVGDGQAATLSVETTGGTSHQWRRNGVDIAGATGATYTTPATSLADNGALFSVVVSNSTGTVTSASATLTVNPVAPLVTEQPANQVVSDGGTASFQIGATGSAPLFFQWRRNGVDIAGASSFVHEVAAATLADHNAQFSVVVSNAAGPVSSNSATLTVNPLAPSITTQPVNVSAVAGQTASFNVVAAGSAPLSYQWRRNAVAITGATASSYTTGATAIGDNNSVYSVVLTTPGGSLSSNNATLSVVALAVAPTVVTAPQNTTVSVGQTATFSVSATGSAPLSYQWAKNGTPIAGANAASYTTPATAALDNGALFTVTIDNAAPGTLTSPAAALTVVALWTGSRTLATTADDQITAVATDAGGNVVVGGLTYGTLPGNTSLGGSDAFIAKYNPTGVLLWARRLGYTAVADTVKGVATDATGNVYAAGSSDLAGLSDSFVTKHTPEGTLLWTHQLASSSIDDAAGIAVDGTGNVFVSGTTRGALPGQTAPAGAAAFLAKIDTLGVRQWIRTWQSTGTADQGGGVAVDAGGNAYVTGSISGAFAGTTAGGNFDGFVAKFDTNGVRLWFSRFGTNLREQPLAISVNPAGTAIHALGSIVKAPTVGGLLHRDVWLSRIDGNGVLQWTRELASLPGPTSNFDDYGLGVATSNDGTAAFVAGYTLGQMPGATPQGYEDIFVARFASNGDLAWVQQYGVAGGTHDRAQAIALDPAGDLFVTGTITGPGLKDGLVLKLRPADGTSY